MKRALGAATACLAISSCQGLSDGAKESFSTEHTCPVDRVEARARPDLQHSSFSTAERPPADIAADPGRLAMWQAREEKTRTAWDSTYEIYEARGCGKQAFYGCQHRPKHIFSVTCRTEAPVPPGIAKW
jgi:hypothetical protein